MNGLVRECTWDDYVAVLASGLCWQEFLLETSLSSQQQQTQPILSWKLFNININCTLYSVHLPSEQICWHKTCWGCCHEFAFFLPRLKWQEDQSAENYWKSLKLLLKYSNFWTSIKIPFNTKDALVVGKISVFQWLWARRRREFP